MTDFSVFGDYKPEDDAWLDAQWPTAAVDAHCPACWVLDGGGKPEFWPCPKHASKEEVA